MHWKQYINLTNKKIKEQAPIFFKSYSEARFTKNKTSLIKLMTFKGPYFFVVENSGLDR